MGQSRQPEVDRDRRTEALMERFGEDYPVYQYAFVEFLVDHLTDVGRSFGGDLQQMLLLAVIGQRRLRAIREAGGDPRAVPPDRMSVTASRLADVTGIPRETVRRKLALLQDRGWIGQGADGGWLILADADGVRTRAREDLAELDLRSRRRVARLIADLEALCDRAGR